MQGTDQFICDITNAFGRIRLFIEQTDCEVPKDDDLIYGSMILWETVVEVHLNVDVQIVFITNDQEAKDQSNRLVAGSDQSFPWDSVKIYIIVWCRAHGCE